MPILKIRRIRTYTKSFFSKCSKNLNFKKGFEPIQRFTVFQEKFRRNKLFTNGGCTKRTISFVSGFEPNFPPYSTINLFNQK